MRLVITDVTIDANNRKSFSEWYIKTILYANFHNFCMSNIKEDKEESRKEKRNTIGKILDYNNGFLHIYNSLKETFKP